VSSDSIPYCTPPVWPDGIAPTRFASLIQSGSLADARGCRVGLIGLPDDMGVRLNGGRPGAAEGPRAFRQALSRYGVARPGPPEGLDWPTLFDAGDVKPAGDIHRTHARVTEAVAALLDAGLLPVGIGGGHDLTFPFVQAVAKRHSPMVGVYFDAHLDVRAEVGSGMSFRALIEQCGISELHAHGLDPSANSIDHARWFTTHGGHVDQFGPSDPWPGGDRSLFVSLDLDVVDQAFAPGVSAMNPCGWSPHESSAWARAAGRQPRVRCFDIMELCPPHDEGGRTARLAAHLFLSFLRGLAERPATGGTA
jgi:arginase family enzyme